MLPQEHTAINRDRRAGHLTSHALGRAIGPWDAFHRRQRPVCAPRVRVCGAVAGERFLTIVI
jgi:hypothetical protein